MGRVEFGIGNADQILMARQQDAPLVAVMASMQDNPRCIMVHQSRGFKVLADLRDLTLAMEEGSPFSVYLQQIATLPNVRIVSYAGSIARFLTDPDFAQQGYVFSEPVVARQQGSDAQSLMLSDAGYNPYAGCVITTEKYIRQHPDIVRRVVRATCRGWKRYLEDPAMTHAEIHRRNPEMDLNSLEEAGKIIRQLCLPDERTSLGTMTADRWRSLANQLREMDLLNLTDEIVNRCYSLEFLPDNS
jgi:NitT/TauT family transport system substrate-binding protein